MDHRVPNPLLYDQNGRPFERNGDGQFAMPHVATFASMWNLASRTYSFRWDEAYKHSQENALAMRRDCFLMGLLNERKYPTAQMPWHLDVDNPTDPNQKAAADYLTTLVKKIPNLQRFLMGLLDALWYGRYGQQIAWKWSTCQGRRVFLPVDHRPVNGDKIQFRYRFDEDADSPIVEDGTPVILTNLTYGSDLPGAEIVFTDRAPGLLLRDPYWRERFIIHKHEVDDADYLEAEMAGAVHGVGIRSRIYWIDWIKREFLSWVGDYMERVGQGLTVFYYEAGNSESKEKAEEAAQKYGRNTVIVWPRPIGNEKQGAGIERQDVPTSGSQFLIDMVKYFDDIQRYYVIGQTLSSQDGPTGLGSGLAEAHMDTKFRIIKFDCVNLGETLTADLLGPLAKWNLPPLDFSIRWVFDIDKPNPKEKLEAAKIVFDMGADVDEAEVRSFAGLSTPKEGDKVLKKPEGPDPSAGGLPGMPGAGGGHPEANGHPRSGQHRNPGTWEPYTGKRGTHGERNRQTGAVRYHEHDGQADHYGPGWDESKVHRDEGGRFAAIAAAGSGHIDGWHVEHAGGDQFRIQTDRGTLIGNPAKIDDFITHRSRNEQSEGKRIQDALARVAAYQEPHFMSEDAHRAAAAFAALPNGTRVVSLAGESKGRIGRIVRTEENGRAINRVKLDGEAGLAMTDEVEPLDVRFSWRASKREETPTTPRLQQATMFARGKGDCQWITIGGSEGPDGKKHGGSPVCIQDGRIIKGHPKLAGKKIEAHGDGPSPHHELKRRILGHLVGGEGPAGLHELRKAMGHGQHDPRNPMANPVHQALKELETSGHVNVHQPRFGDPRVWHTGQPLSDPGKPSYKLSGEPDPATHRQQLNRGKEYERAVWGKKARKEGIPPQHLHTLAKEIQDHDRAFKESIAQVLREARHMSKTQGYGDIGNLRTLAGSGRVEDAASVRGLDDIAKSLSAKYPEIVGDESEAEGRLFDLLSQGNPVPMTAAEAFEQAFNHLLERKHSQPVRQHDEDAVPFMRWDGQPLRYEGEEERDEEGDSRDDGEELGQWYADEWNALIDSGHEVPADELEAAGDELDGSGWFLHFDSEAYEWVVLSADDFDEADQYAAQARAPKGGVSLNGRHYRGGQWIPSEAMAGASDEDKQRIESAHQEHRQKREQRGHVDPVALQKKLSPHGSIDLSEAEIKKARAAFRGLHRHHDDLTVHRIEELVDGLAKAIQNIHPDDPGAEGLREHFARRLKAYQLMLDWAGEKGVSGQVKGKEPPKPTTPPQTDPKESLRDAIQSNPWSTLNAERPRSEDLKRAQEAMSAIERHSQALGPVEAQKVFDAAGRGDYGPNTERAQKARAEREARESKQKEEGRHPLIDAHPSRITRVRNGQFQVKTTYGEPFVQELKKLGATWNRDDRRWEVPVKKEAELRQLLEPKSKPDAKPIPQPGAAQRTSYYGHTPLPTVASVRDVSPQDVQQVIGAFHLSDMRGDNLVHLTDLREKLGWDKERFARAVRRGQVDGHLSLRPHEFRSLDARDRDGLLTQAGDRPGEDQQFLYVSMRRQ